MILRLVVNCVVNLVLTLQCLDPNTLCWWVLPNGGKQLSLWRPCWRFLWRGSREYRPLQATVLIALSDFVYGYFL